MRGHSAEEDRRVLENLENIDIIDSLVVATWPDGTEGDCSANTCHNTDVVVTFSLGEHARLLPAGGSEMGFRIPELKCKQQETSSEYESNTTEISKDSVGSAMSRIDHDSKVVQEAARQKIHGSTCSFSSLVPRETNIHRQLIKHEGSEALFGCTQSLNDVAQQDQSLRGRRTKGEQQKRKIKASSSGFSMSPATSQEILESISKTVVLKPGAPADDTGAKLLVTISEQTREIENLRFLRDKLQVQLESERKKTPRQLVAKLDAECMKTSELNKEIKSLRKQRDRIVAALETERRTTLQQIKEIDAACVVRDKALAQLEAAKAQTARLERDVHALRNGDVDATIHTACGHVAAMERELSETRTGREQVRVAQDRVAELQGQLRACSERVKEQLHHANQSAQMLKEDVHARDRDRQELAQAKDREAMLEQQLAACAKALEQLQKANARIEAPEKEVRARSEDDKGAQQLREMSARVVVLEEQLQARDQDMKRALDGAAERVAALENELDTRKEVLDRAKERLEQVEGRLLACSGDKEQLKSARKLIVSMKLQVDAHRLAAADLTTQLRDATVKMSQQSTLIECLNAAKAALQQENASLQQQLGEAVGRLRERTRECDELRANVGERGARINALLADVEALREQEEDARHRAMDYKAAARVSCCRKLSGLRKGLERLQRCVAGVEAAWGGIAGGCGVTSCVGSSKKRHKKPRTSTCHDKTKQQQQQPGRGKTSKTRGVRTQAAGHGADVDDEEGGDVRAALDLPTQEIRNDFARHLGDLKCILVGMHGYVCAEEAVSRPVVLFPFIDMLPNVRANMCLHAFEYVLVNTCIRMLAHTRLVMCPQTTLFALTRARTHQALYMTLSVS